MTLNAYDLNHGGLKIEKEIRFLFCIDLTGNHMKLSSKIQSIMLKKFTQVKEKVLGKLLLVGTYTLVAM